MGPQWGAVSIWGIMAKLCHSKEKCSQTRCLHRRAVTNVVQSGCCCPDGRSQAHAPWQQAASLRGQMPLLGMRLQRNPGKKRALPWLTTACRGAKASLKPPYPCLQMADRGSLRLFAAHKPGQENCKGPLQTAVSACSGARGAERMSPWLKASVNQKGFAVKPITLLTSARGWPPFWGSVPSRCLPAAETPSGEMPTVIYLLWKWKKDFMFSPKHNGIFQSSKAPRLKQSQLTFEHPRQSHLKSGRLWAYFH